MHNSQKKENQQFIKFCEKAANNSHLATEIISSTGIYTKTGRLSSNFNHKLTHVSKKK